ncbi:DNA-binding protein P3A2 isoform X2 [Patella vulgata]|uniref:DNA-binding protein P3A2 isoform X2 n=1 Tax=Patella vulgata TaxID=6465 RepID=UPI0021806EE3|nr:DNA-binding protein P3A2 isoform X2 [Patella vulgata]
MMMNVHSLSNSISINTSQLNATMMDDDISDPSSPESTFDASELLHGSVSDEVTAQLAAAGTVGIAAAAAIATGRRKGHPHQFETNPSRRKRQQTRLLRKLKNTIEEYTTRVGQQAVVLCCTPGRPNSSNSSFKVFGSQPLENIKSTKAAVMQDLEAMLQQEAPQTGVDTSHLHELPPLVIDGIPTQVDKMTQAQLRNFIPEMLKYSTGRSKPGWGKPECRPAWWPVDLPWANVRSDARSDEEKKRVSWTEALRTIVKNCYKHHGREDLLSVFNEGVVQQATVNYASTMYQTINNPDGTVSIIHIETGPNGNPVVTLPDGTQATVVHAIPGHTQQEATQAVQTLADVATNQEIGNHMTPVSVEMADGQGGVATLSGATINQNGQIILTGDASIGGIVTIPASVYQTVATSLASITDGVQQNVQVAMAPITLKTEVPDATQAVEVSSMDQSQITRNAT